VETRINVRSLVSGVALAVLLLSGCGRKDEQPAAQRGNSQTTTLAPGQQAGVTPMAERVAVIGLLNKRNGIVRDLTLKPGEAVQVRDAIVRLRACETTAPWESEKLTGAFLQLEVQRPDRRWQRVFSGWVYKESPSLNVVESPVYDVWPKSCAMTYPSGPGEPVAPVTSSNRSSARKSGGADRGSTAPATSTPSADTTPAAPATEPAPPPPSAPDNNAT
jgi:hypothetical protein